MTEKLYEVGGQNIFPRYSSDSATEITGFFQVPISAIDENGRVEWGQVIPVEPEVAKAALYSRIHNKER